ncbi:hypothetical protein SRCM101266_01577 [Bacillus amyloliquefaciens]|nr:hypothetical protein SRCM101266_01577 [Bacillus amyloliquefaciens]
MFDHDTLRLSGRSRRVNHIREVIRRCFRLRVRFIIFIKRQAQNRAAAVKQNRFSGVAIRHIERFLREKQLGAAVLQNVADTFFRIVRINRHKCRSRFQDAEYARGHFQGRFRQNADPFVSRGTAIHENARNAVRPCVQLAVHPFHAVVRHGRTVCVAGSRFFKETVNRFVPRHGKRFSFPCVKKGLLFSIADQ